MSALINNDLPKKMKALLYVQQVSLSIGSDRSPYVAVSVANALLQHSYSEPRKYGLTEVNLPVVRENDVLMYALPTVS